MCKTASPRLTLIFLNLKFPRIRQALKPKYIAQSPLMFNFSKMTSYTVFVRQLSSQLHPDYGPPQLVLSLAHHNILKYINAS